MDQWILWGMKAGLPIVAAYHMLCENTFLNVSAVDAEGVERVANLCLAPVQYLLAGKIATPVFSLEGEVVGYTLEQRFSYEEEDPFFWLKTLGSYSALPTSLVLGSLLKGVAYLSEETRKRHQHIVFGPPFLSQTSFYSSLGIQTVDFARAESAPCQGYQRRPGDAEKLQEEKKALKAITQLFHQHGIVYWLDCGTCLGAYRYGGNIPWDWDIDLAILQPDFDTVKHILSSYLDPQKYAVQDWSGRDRPKTYLKVYVKDSGALIDIYHFAIRPEQKEIQSILSNEHSMFLTEGWRTRERRYIVPTSFDIVFPLKKASFDGIEAFVPSKIEEYLVQRYIDIRPAKLYSQTTGEYEKDLSHPYWDGGNRY